MWLFKTPIPNNTIFIPKLNGSLMCYIDKRKPTGLKGTHLLKSKLNQVAKPLNKSENDKFLSYGYYISPEIIQKKFKSKPSLTYYKCSILNANSRKRRGQDSQITSQRD
jgi:hypothetical protein